MKLVEEIFSIAYNFDSNKVIVEGVNKRFRHLKPTQTNPKGGRIEKECPIHISNVQLKSIYDAKRAAK